MKKTRIKKTLTGLLEDLDDHLYLLRDCILNQERDVTYLKSIASGLRVLVCFSSGTEGLLWRVAEQLGISDAVAIHLAGDVDVEHPLAKDLSLAFVPIQYAGFGPAELPPREYTLKGVIKRSAAVFVQGQNVTHEYLITTIAQQMGGAHEDDAIESYLAMLRELQINGVQPYVPILIRDSELTLQVGERVLCAAERKSAFQRKRRSPDYGNLSVVLRMGYLVIPTCKTEVAVLQSFIGETQLAFSLTENAIVCEILKAGRTVDTISTAHPSDWQPRSDVVIAISYCSRAKQIRLVLSNNYCDIKRSCDIGWLHARDMAMVDRGSVSRDLVYRQFLFTYSRLLSTHEVTELSQLELQNDGNWSSSDGTPLFVEQENVAGSRDVFPP
jgi:hypothetical protein